MGRPLGAKNKFSQEARQAIRDAFEAMGGAAGLAAWAAKNPDAFYLHIWTRLVPKAAASDPSQQLQATVTVNAVNVLDPSAALSELEKLEDARYAAMGKPTVDELVRVIRAGGLEEQALKELRNAYAVEADGAG